MFKNMRVTCKEIRPHGHVRSTIKEFDSRGNCTLSQHSVTGSGNVVKGPIIKEREYDEFNHVVFIRSYGASTLSMELHVTNTYDENNRLINTINSYGDETWNRYDDRGRLIFTENNAGDYQIIEYIDDSNLIKMITHNHCTVKYEYDSRGNCIHEIRTFIIGKEKSYEIYMSYNEKGDVIEEWFIGSGLESPTKYEYEYDDLGRKISVISSNGIQTTWEYQQL